jgi:DnaB-like helicase C terminal domain
MSHQMALCYRVIKTRDIEPVLSYGITADDFITPEAKALWVSILNYYTDPTTAGSIPDPYVLSVHNKMVFNMGDDMPGTSLEGLCSEVRRLRVRAQSQEDAVKFSQAMAEYQMDPMGPINELQARLQAYQALGTTANTDMSLLQGMESVWRRKEWAKEGLDFSKAPWPWPSLQAETFGIQPDDFIVFYGRPKSMKTWVLAFLISWCFHQQKRIVVYTKEMTQDNVYLRTLACILGFGYRELRGAVLSKFHPMDTNDERRFGEFITWLRNDPVMANLIQVVNGREVGPGNDTVPWLRSKIKQYSPDITFVDGFYLMSDARKHTSDHQRVMNISRDLRDMNLGTNVPIIATIQANRKAEGHGQASSGEIAYSDAVGQDATMFARVIADKESPTISLVVGGSREFALHGIRIHAIPARNFSEHSVLEEKDIKKAVEGDQGEDEKKPKKAKKGGQQEPADTFNKDLNQQMSSVKPS